ncbi:hypothetical protein ACWV26_11985 [Rummeliibacillus sp. JY-2-4R]
MIYNQKELKMLEDRYENEFSFSFLTLEKPKEINHMLETNTEHLFKDFWMKQYNILVVVPNLFLAKLKISYYTLVKNNSFTLICIKKNTEINNIIKNLKENEYINGFYAFLIKSLDDIIFDLPLTSQERIKMKHLVNNEIVVFSFDVDEVVLLTF